MKRFDVKWSKEEIDEWVDIYNVLVLFEEWVGREAKVVIHGKIDATNQMKLAEAIVRYFGGTHMTPSVCRKVNEFSQKWYNKNILNKKARVLNSKGKKK